MKRDLIIDTTKKIGDTVTIYGWINNRRDHGRLIFIDLKDRSGAIQCVFSPVTKGFEKAKKLRPQWTVKLTGFVKKRPEKLINPDLPTGEVELEVVELEILSRAQELPIDISSPEMRLNLETLLDLRNLTIRNEKVKAIFIVFDELLRSFEKVMRKLGFFEIKTPKIVYSSTEGGADFFKIDYFQKQAYLAQSPQFYKQAAAASLERVFEIGPVFRAEHHFTSRHVNEFTGLDAEMAFIESFEDVMDVLQEVITYLLKKIAKNCADQLSLYGQKLEIADEIPRIKFLDALSVLEKNYNKTISDLDIDPEGEKLICQWAKENYQSDLLFVTHYPTALRPAYTFPDPQDPKLTWSFDLLFRGIEIASGSQRINDPDQLIESFKKKNLNPKNFTHYLEIFKYGMPPHGGFGLGAERIIQRILSLGSIKEAILFPRDVKRLTP